LPLFSRPKTSWTSWFLNSSCFVGAEDVAMMICLAWIVQLLWNLTGYSIIATREECLCRLDRRDDGNYFWAVMITTTRRWIRRQDFVHSTRWTPPGLALTWLWFFCLLANLCGRLWYVVLYYYVAWRVSVVRARWKVIVSTSNRAFIDPAQEAFVKISGIFCGCVFVSELDTYIIPLFLPLSNELPFWVLFSRQHSPRPHRPDRCVGSHLISRLVLRVGTIAQGELWYEYKGPLL
jgi:hypothetical protein